MAIFDCYRAGYERGYTAGYEKERRLPRWELTLRSPLTWLPGVDVESYVRGYLEGYTYGLTIRNAV